MNVNHFYNVAEKDKVKKARELLNGARLHVVAGKCSGMAYLIDPAEYGIWIATIDTLRESEKALTLEKPEA